MEFADIVMSRYATKKFDGRNIPENTINELLEIVRFAPSPLNLQPWKIKVVTDQIVNEQLKPAACNQEQVTSCSHLLVFCADPDYDSLIHRLGALLKRVVHLTRCRRCVPTILCPVGYVADKPMQKIRFAQEEIVF
jgi:nitroreductase / dihydropteridine reductase